MLLLFPAALGHAVRPSASVAESFPWLTSPETHTTTQAMGVVGYAPSARASLAAHGPLAGPCSCPLSLPARGTAHRRLRSQGSTSAASPPDISITLS